MKEIEKKCPNCSKVLEVDPSLKEIKCPNCNREYTIEKSRIKRKGKEVESINLVMKVSKNVFVIPVVIFSSIILILTLATIHSVNNYKLKLKGQDETKELHDNIKKIKDIDKEKIEEKSLSEINNWNVEKDNVHLGNSKELGQYLYRVNNHSTIYDVYELTYKINNSDYTIYTAVVYNDLTKDNINQLIPEIHGATITKGNENLWGYDTIKDLYYDINTPEKSKLEVTKGLYMEK